MTLQAEWLRKSWWACLLLFAAAIGAYAEEGVVVLAEGPTVMIDLGERAGVKTGDTVSIIRQLDKAVHPVSGAVLEILAKNLATAKVTEVHDVFSFVELQGGAKPSDVQAGDSVRLPASGEAGATQWLPPVGQMLVNETFDGKLDRWEPFRGEWFISGGGVKAVPDKERKRAGMASKALFGPNVSIAFRVKVEESNPKGAVAFNVYIPGTHRELYAFILPQQGSARAEKDQLKIAENPKFHLSGGGPYEVAMRRIGGYVTVKVDDAEVLSFVDRDSPREETDLGLFAVESSATFDNVRITAFPVEKPVLTDRMDTGQGFVCYLKENEVRIDYGEGTVRVGQKLPVARLSKAVKKPNSEDLFALKLDKVGEVEVVKVGPTTSEARVVSGKEMKRGDRVLLEEAKPDVTSWWRKL